MFESTNSVTVVAGAENYVHPRIKRIKSRENGIGLNLLARIKKSHRGDPLRQVNEFFDHFEFHAGTGRTRNVSIATKLAYRNRMIELVKLLQKLNMPIQNLDEISAKQIRHVFSECERLGHSASWVANFNTGIRRFGVWIGKPELCPAVRHLVKSPENYIRKQSATSPKDWTSANVDFEDICEEIEFHCPVTAMQMRLSGAFGTRVQEFLMFRPGVKVSDGMDCIYLDEGTKGGRPRFVPVETQAQRELLIQAKTMANPVSGLLVANPGYSLRQAIKYHSNLMAKLGITKKQLGITTHGLRHGYACDLYKKITGVDAPVLGGGPVDKELDKKARKEIAERLGHSRTDITSNYIGNYQTMQKTQKKKLGWLIRALESNTDLRELVQSFEIEGVFLLGEASKGNWAPKDKTTLVIGYSAKKVQGQNQQVSDVAQLTNAYSISQAIQKILNVEVAIKPMSNYLGNETCELDFFSAPASHTVLVPHFG